MHRLEELLLHKVKTMKRLAGLLVIVSSLFVTSFSVDNDGVPPSFLEEDSVWVDSVFNTLSPQDRIAQLFMVAAYSNKGLTHVASIKKLIQDYKIGGLIFFQGGPVRQAMLTNEYQQLSKTPLLISIDAEWGLAMRLDSTVKFPHQMALGAIQNDSLIYKMGAEIARQCRRLGMHVNLAPVVDINNNPLNPVIGTRSFGENKYNVARKALMYMHGMQDNFVMANAKHFPGHGDTDSDSHKTLPIVSASRERLDSLELYPFKALMKEGLASVMVAHLYIPSLGTKTNQASTLTKEVVTDLLKNDLKFKGLVFTDALNMKGVSKYYEPGRADVEALLAGNDVLLFSGDVPLAIKQIEEAIKMGSITQQEVDNRCKKILLAKKWAGLDTLQAISRNNLVEDLNTIESDVLNRSLTQASLTVLRNKNNLLPLKRLDTLSIASVSLGIADETIFQKTLSKYNTVDHFSISKNASKEAFNELINKLENYNLVIIQLNNTSSRPYKRFGLTNNVVDALNSIVKEYRTVVSVSQSPYILSKLSDVHLADAIIMSYEENAYSELYSAQAIFGGLGVDGKLPVTVNDKFKEGEGDTLIANRLGYDIPEKVGVNSTMLKPIDSIVNKSIQDKVFPGCQILVAKGGNVIYSRSFGYHTYDSAISVKSNDLYDIASITKIMATTPSLMKLVDDGKVELDKYLCDYLPMVKDTDKENISLREMMTHQAGLKSWIPLWKFAMEDGKYKDSIFDTSRSVEYPKRVAHNLFIHSTYEDSIFQFILDSPTKEKGNYLYSDLGYYFLNKIIEAETYVPENRFVQKYFYAPLGLSTMGYLPKNRFDLDRIVPTEMDTVFRKQLVHGDVHDPGAAMLGGVGGHAGVFSNANDIAVMMQMYLNKGVYGGKRYLDSSTVVEFTKCQYCKANRRAIGFDRPAKKGDPSPVCGCVSYLSFGHAGFTGTLAWADPEHDLIYIFLSNRVHPSAKDNQLSKRGIRTEIQELIYQAVN